MSSRYSDVIDLAGDGSGGGAGALIVATRSDNNNPAVFADFSALETYAATPSGSTDANAINVSDQNDAEQVFAVGTLTAANQVETITAAFIRLNDNWQAVATNLVGTPGLPGPSGEGSIPPFASNADRDSFFLTASNRPSLLNDLPIEVNVGSNTVENQIWTGVTNPSDYVSNDPRWITARFRVSNGSIDIGPDMTISNGQNVVEVRRPNDTTSELVQSLYDNNGSTRPFYQRLSAIQNLNVNTTTDQTIADPFTLTYTTVGNNKTISFDIIPAEAGTLRAVFRETNSSGDVIFDEFQDFTQQQVDDGNPVPFTIGNRYSLPAGTVLFVSFTGIQLKGGVAGPGDALQGQTTPYFVSQIQPYTNVDLITDEDIDHPVTLRRDMPSAEDSLALVNASLNNNSALWVVAANQLSNSNRNDATIYALQAGFLDLDGNEIPTTPTDASTIQLRGGSVVRIFGQNDFRVVTSPVLEDDTTQITGIRAGVTGRELTITLDRDNSQAALAATVTLPAGGGTQPPSTAASITRFEIDGQATSVLSGTQISGTKTFNYNVNHPEDVNGNLSLVQNGVVLKSDISPSGNTFTQAITSQTLQNNQQAVFELRGITNEGIAIQMFFRVRAHLPAEQLYYGLSSSNNPALVDISQFSHIEAGIDGAEIETGTTTATQFFIVLVPANHDLVRISDALGQDVTSIFTKTTNVRQINSVNYNSYVFGPVTAGSTERFTLGY